MLERRPARETRIAACLRAGVLCLLSASTLATLVPRSARADGDPASDVLLASKLFAPPETSTSLEEALLRALAAYAREDGVHLKVAIINTEAELGLEPQFYGHAQAYAEFLDREISGKRPLPLLTVMSSGFGTVPPGNARALAGLGIDPGELPDALARSAIRAVLALARAAGHPIPTPAVTGPTASASHVVGKAGPPLLLVALPVILVLAGGTMLARRARRPRPPNT